MSWNEFWGGVGEAVTGTVSAVSDVVDDAADTLGEVVDAVGDALFGAVDDAQAAGKAAATAVTDPFGTARIIVEHGVATGEGVVEGLAQAGHTGVAFLGGTAEKGIDHAEQLAEQAGEALDEAGELIAHMAGRAASSVVAIPSLPGLVVGVLVDEGAEWYGWAKETAVDTFVEGVGLGRAGTAARFGDEAAGLVDDAIRLGGFDPEDFPPPDGFEGVDDAVTAVGQAAEEVAAAAVEQVAAVAEDGASEPVGTRTQVVASRAEHAQLRAERLDRLREEQDVVNRGEDVPVDEGDDTGATSASGTIATDDEEATGPDESMEALVAGLRDELEGRARDVSDRLGDTQEDHRQLVDEQLDKAREAYPESAADPRAATLRDLTDRALPGRQQQLDRVREIREGRGEQRGDGGDEITELTALVSGQATGHEALLAAGAARHGAARDASSRGTPEDDRTNVAEVLVEAAATEAAVAETMANEAAFFAAEAAVARLAAVEAEGAGDVAAAAVHYRAADGLAFARDRSLVTAGAARRSAQETAEVTRHVADDRPDLVPEDVASAVTSLAAQTMSTAELVERYAAELDLDDLEDRVGLVDPSAAPPVGEDAATEPATSQDELVDESDTSPLGEDDPHAADVDPDSGGSDSAGTPGAGGPASSMAGTPGKPDDDFGAGAPDLVGVALAATIATPRADPFDQPPSPSALDELVQSEEEPPSMPSDASSYLDDDPDELNEPELGADE